MRLSVNENKIINEIGAVHPTKSSFSKLVKALGMARNEIGETVEGLKSVGYLSVTAVNEIYLLADGRKHLGIDVDDITTTPKPEKTAVKPVGLPSTSLGGQPGTYRIPVNAAPSFIHPTTKTKEAITGVTVLAQLDKLADKLNKPTVTIDDFETKLAVLERLGVILSNDVEVMLLAIRDDLISAVVNATRDSLSRN